MGRWSYRFRWWIVAVWAAAALALAVLAPAADSTVGETTDLLPSDTPVHVALDQLAAHFGDKSGLSSIIVVFERQDGPLSQSDLATVERVAAELQHPLADETRDGENISAELSSASIRTPASLAISGKDNPMISRDGHAALVWISLPYNYISKTAARLVKHVQEAVAGETLPAGLTASVTGSAGFGYDYSIATQRSHDKTLVVTLVSVILILLFVYRAPLAAAVPLAAISLAAAVVFKVLDIAALHGVHSGTAEQIFTFVLLYGAGIDYSLLLMSRYRELLDSGMAPADAIVTAVDASIGAIASSAAMTTAGLAMLYFGRFSVYRNSAPAVILAVIGAATAAITLSPAIVAILGPRIFWPHYHRGQRIGAPPSKWKAWPAIARVVVNRPGWVMTLTLTLLLPPAVRGLHIDWSYDALYSLKNFYQARIGAETVQRHWPIGEIAPVNILILAPSPRSGDAWIASAAATTSAVRSEKIVADVRAASNPLGLRTSAAENSAMLLLARQRVLEEFVSPDGLAMRMSVVLNKPPFSREAMNCIDHIRAAAAGAQGSASNAGIFISGSTAEMVDLRTITGQDFARVAPLALAVILLVVTLVLRDLLLSIFILAATVLSYMTTLGLTDWFFHVAGATGLEWKVQMLLFIVLVAVGQDYSIFFCMRLAQESRSFPPREATRRALVFTGPVISSCGLIMAATLGSIMAGDVQTLVQLGFAFALGMLIDTFLVRPLLLPAFVILTGRTLSRAAMHAPAEVEAIAVAAETPGDEHLK